MELDNKTLSFLSLLIIPGILLITFFNDHLILLPLSMCIIGGLSFGTLLARIL